MIPLYTWYEARSGKSRIGKPTSRPLRRFSFPTWSWALCVLAFYLLLGAWATGIFGLVAPDASARTGTAAAILWSRNPHYGALLTAWGPLTTGLQLPLVWLLGVLFNAPQFSANVLSALASTASLGLLYRLFGVLGFQGRMRWLPVALYATNPLILLYAASGSSASLLITCLLLAIYGLAAWWQSGQPGYLGLSGLGITGAFLINYESLLFGVVVAAAFLYGLKRRGMAHPLARLTLYIMPIFYTLLFWFAFNLISMRDPFAFLNADLYVSANELSGPSGTATLSSPLGVLNNPGRALVYTLLLAFVVLICVLNRRDTGDHDTDIGNATQAKPTIWLALLLAASLGAAVLLLWPGQSLAQTGPSSGGYSSSSVSVAEEQVVGDYLRSDVLADARILVDQGDTYPIIDKAGQPNRFVIPSDIDYDEIIANAAQDIDYILLRNNDPGKPGAIQYAYPMLYESRWPYAQLVHDFGGQMGWRLYRVTQPESKK
ncbi:MAG TPA: glycosyltransferase family 39 protein [Chloroflexia bacterium]|nr:glycosyltransferase family 39 protein [Chloroflexia bacterium]